MPAFRRKTPGHRLPLIALATGVCMAALSGAALAQTTSDPADGGATVDDVIVTGTRGQARTVATSVSPIDVVPSTQLFTVGHDGLQEALNALLPSYNLPAMTGGGTGGVIRAAGLRGLNSDQVLVLVNGKRRHNGALIQSGSWTSSGSTPVDLDLIPTAAIDHIEVLRDGASAQYGSDAISGVINIILKDAPSGGQAQIGIGSNYEGDGVTRQYSLSGGFALPNEGSLYLALDRREQDNYTRADPAMRTGFGPTGSIINIGNELINQGYGNPKVETTTLSFNAELPLSNGFDLYSFGTVSAKEGWKHGNFRQATANGNIVELYPEGGSPRIGYDEKDYQATLGARGSLWGWDADFSTSYAHDDAKLPTVDNLNPTLGPSSPTEFHLGSQVFTQWTSNADFSRQFDTGLARPTQVSFGLEHRFEEWKLLAGEEKSYSDGGYVYTSGPYAGQITNRSTGVRGVSPDDAGQADRNVFAIYGDVGFYPLDRWYTAVAVRHERYDDSAGDTTNYKLSTRYEITPDLAIRATASTGFRAPSVAQSTYQQSAVSAYQATTAGYVQYFYKVVAPGSAIGSALGATPLTPEKSDNYSVGLSWTPGNKFTFTVDAYQIDIKDRIVRSSTLTGASVVSLLESFGLRDYTGAEFYTNAVDTRTTGVDVVAEYRANYGDFGRVRWTAAYNHNETEIQAIDNLVVPGTNFQIFGHSAQGYLEHGNPRDKVILGANWSLDGWTANLRGTRYGSVIQPGTTEATDREFSAKWLVDLNVDYSFGNGINLAVGANNLFDEYPDKVGIVSNTGLGAYGYISPFGFGGGYYYTRLTYTF